ncbi:hypothetical protein [Longimicrobium terrae]|uniref:Lipoprotein n=1 Tax=Longimicrobium terrae TaxID=1639882 RepID=A0A841H6X7_9BACT|nr:hypothetical protein [Longimicrobium terrae]MBB4639508.1 hypothetical protein [Longimicrobium terrae]MBB6073880.1 hypothetical protein [Longimicrobium terrae]NNC32502.1 hypothetical protein [Longimicrobium terrae]
MKIRRLLLALALLAAPVLGACTGASPTIPDTAEGCGGYMGSGGGRTCS